MELNSVVDTLSLSLESCGPFSVTDPEPSNNMDEPDISQLDALVEPFDSVIRRESLDLRDNNGKYNSRFVDAQRKVPGNLCSITRRSTRNSSSNQKNDNKLAARKCSRTSGKRAKQDLLPVNVGRRHRSDLARRARASVWGLGGNINEVFEQNDEKNANELGRIQSRKGRTGGSGGKRTTNAVSRSIQSTMGENQASERVKTKGENQASERGLIVKFKLAKKVTETCQLNRVPVIDDELECYREVKIEASNLTSDIRVNSEEQVPSASTSQSCNGNLDNGASPSEAAVISVLSDKNRSGNLADIGGTDVNDAIGVGETVENRCLDAGTSPDSEVIDVIPETQISGAAAEGLHDIQISSKDRDASQAGYCGVENELPSPEIINDVLLGDKYEQNKKIIDGSCFGCASISTTTGFASSNSFNREGCPMEPITSLQETEVGVSMEMLTIERGRQTDISVDAGLESVSWVTEKLFPVAKSNTQKLQKSSRSKGVIKARSDVPASLSRKQTNCQQKGSQPKSTGKGKMEKNKNVDAVREMGSHPRPGNYETNDIGELKEHCGSTAEALSNSTIVHCEGKNQHGSPRNAWVCCDDCHKWRRIPALLADSIESTDRRWVCMDNMDKVFADCSIPQEKSNSDINEELEISDEEDAYKSRKNFTSVEQKQPIDPPQSSWKLIRTNLFLHRNRKNQTIDEIMVCHCKPPLDGRRGCRDGCLNRMLNIECAKGTCPCGELCSNQQFQKRKYAKLKCFRCGKKGYGLQLQEDIPKGRFLIEYVGEVLDMTAYEARQREYASKGHKHFYFMTLNGSEVIDACAKGNLGRFINHSCEPNCRTEKWMVNGEVCIGLFAIRDIKKGEELTFDYNYVRVFGAAAKKCVCGSSRCRGFIGGDPLNAETVVLGDSDEEYPEPVMFYRNGSVKLDNVLDDISSFDGAGMQSAENTCENNGGEMDKCTTAAEDLETMGNKQKPYSLLVSDDEIDNSRFPIECAEKEVSFKRSSSAASASESKLEDRLLAFAVQPLDTSLQQNNKKSEITSLGPLDHSVAEEDVNRYLSTGERTKISPTSPVNLLPIDTQRKPKSHVDENKSIIAKPDSRTKITRVSAVVKRRKPKRNVTISKPPEIDNKSQVVHHDTKRLVDEALNGRFGAVQEALNVLLNDKGGISRRRDASKGYLKLLILTAASGEGIQSTRDLSMILDALLKTNSRTVLLDIINKNGLQMLHNIMKRYRWEFNKIPILRKLLKVIEHLADLKILTLENILKPSRLGAESFKESMLLLTEHADKQVHQFARSFRDKWIPWSERKINWVERDVERTEHQTNSNFHKFTTPHNYSSDRDKKPSEVADTPNRHTPPVDTKPPEVISTSCITSGVTDATRPRKRKSRWDQPGDVGSEMGSPPKKEQKSINGGPEKVKGTSHDMHEERQNTDDDADAPPGFSSPINRQSLPKVVMGYPQERYNSRLPTSFGVPSSVFQKLGLPKGAPAESWVIAPAVTFLPFPPLPVCPRRSNSVGVHMEKDHPNHFTPNFQNFRNSSNRLGRRYFRQQKWNDPRPPGLPWNPNKNSYGGFNGPNYPNIGAGYGGNEANGTYNNTGFVSNNNESYGNRFYQQPPHQ